MSKPLTVTVYASSGPVELEITAEEAWEAIRLSRGRFTASREARPDVDRGMTAVVLATSLMQSAREQGWINVVDRAGSVWVISVGGLVGIHVEDPEGNASTSTVPVGFRFPGSEPRPEGSGSFTSSRDHDRPAENG